MAQAARHFLGCFQDEGIGTGRGRFQQPVLAVVDARILRNFAQIAAQQGQVMLVVDAADAAQAFHRALVIQMADQRIAGIGRQRDDAAGVDDLRRLLDQPQLRIFGMDLKKLAHKKKTAAALGLPPIM